MLFTFNYHYLFSRVIPYVTVTIFAAFFGLVLPANDLLLAGGLILKG